GTVRNRAPDAFDALGKMTPFDGAQAVFWTNAAGPRRPVWHGRVVVGENNQSVASGRGEQTRDAHCMLCTGRDPILARKRDRNECANEREVAPAQRSGQRLRVGRQKSPVAELGARVTG